VFGPYILDQGVDTVYSMLRGWGYRLDTAGNRSVRTLIAHAMLLSRSPSLADMDAALLERLRQAIRFTGRTSGDLHPLQRALATLGRCEPPDARNETLLREVRAPRWTNVPVPWAETTARPSARTPPTSSPATPSDCSTSRPTRPARVSPSRSTRCSDRASRSGRPSAPNSR
jgi:hypothetical protein